MFEQPFVNSCLNSYNFRVKSESRRIALLKEYDLSFVLLYSLDLFSFLSPFSFHLFLILMISSCLTY